MEKKNILINLNRIIFILSLAGLLMGVYVLQSFLRDSGIVCFVTWFTYTEIFLIKGICMWCAISAVNMYIIFGLVVLSFRLLKQPK